MAALCGSSGVAIPACRIPLYCNGRDSSDAFQRNDRCKPQYATERAAQTLDPKFIFLAWGPEGKKKLNKPSCYRTETAQQAAGN